MAGRDDSFKVVGQRSDLLDRFAGRGIHTDSLEQATDGVRRLSTNAEPILGAVDVNLELLAFVLFDGIEMTKLFDGFTISRRTLVHRRDTVEGAMSASKSFESQFDHNSSPGVEQFRATKCIEFRLS